MIKRLVLLGKKHFLTAAYFFGIYLVFLANSFHDRHSDEFDNILGGLFINHGILPYTGFFSHHGPVSYFLASFLTAFSGQSFVAFRFLSTFFFFALMLATFFLLKKRVKTIETKFLFVYATVATLASTHFWGHMFLADPISGYFLIVSYGLLFLKMFAKEKLERIDLVIISIFSFLTVLNSITYIYAVFVIVFATISYYLWYIAKRPVRITKHTFKEVSLVLAIFSIPYLVFLLYLLVTRSLNDYVFQAIIYNKNYYVYNYPRPPGSTSINPIRYAIVIFNNFYNAYQPLLVGVKDFPFSNPFNATMALSNVFLWVFLLFKKRYFLFLFSLLIIVYITVRSNLLYSKATDYQSATYFFISFFNASFLFFAVNQYIETSKNLLQRIVLGFLFILFIIYWFFNFLFIFGNIFRMTYSRYMGTMPLIYDRPQVAGIINEIVPENNYCWVGPFAFEEMFFLRCKLPSSYHWILPQFAGIESIKKELLSEHEKNKADVIVYNRRFEIFGASSLYNKFFTDFLDKNYVRLKDINPNYHFREKTLDFRLDEDFNFEKTKAFELTQLLKQKGYIEER